MLDFALCLAQPSADILTLCVLLVAYPKPLPIKWGYNQAEYKLYAMHRAFTNELS